MKAKILADFQICVSVPLILEAKFGEDPLQSKKNNKILGNEKRNMKLNLSKTGWYLINISQKCNLAISKHVREKSMSATAQFLFTQILFLFIYIFCFY